MSIQSINATAEVYKAALLEWRQQKDEALRSEDGWLTLTGLFMLKDGENSVGACSSADVVLPAGSAPDKIGMITFENGNATLHVTCAEPIFVDGSPARTALLKDDNDENGPTLVTVNTITFYLIKRGDTYAIRVRDRNNPARQGFQGRHWFAPDPTYRVEARYTPHAVPRSLPIVTSNGLLTPMDNIGYVEFTLESRTLRLEAFSEGEDELWFIFRDQTSGTLTYGAGRFLKVRLTQDGLIDLDFNRAYSPPCAFTYFATCPLPPKENNLPVRIEAGEKL